jgi:hypothetical protein
VNHPRGSALHLVLWVALVLLSGCARGQNQAATLHSVRYEVQGTATSAALTYRNSTGGTEQINVTLPWSTEFQLKTGEAVFLSARNTDKDGSVRCTISLDNQVFRTAESTGANKTCSGRGIIGL